MRTEHQTTVLLFALYTPYTAEALPLHLIFGLQVSLPPNYELLKDKVVSRRNHNYSTLHLQMSNY